MRCSVCRGELAKFGEGVILAKLSVTYFRCEDCRIVLLPAPTWLDEAYSDAISQLDVGLLSRCLSAARLTSRVMRTERLESGCGLDWAGGYGTLTRLMRDKGFNFSHYDPFCVNLFAAGFEGTLTQQYDLVTAFEVLEHLPEPIAALGDVAACSDLMLFSTLLLPEPAPSPLEWWYYAPESGQHVAFHTKASLRALGEQLGYRLLSNGVDLHLFYRGRLSVRTRWLFSRTAKRVDAAWFRATHSLGVVGDAPRSLLEADAQRAIEKKHSAGRSAGATKISPDGHGRP